MVELPATPLPLLTAIDAKIPAACPTVVLPNIGYKFAAVPVIPPILT